MSEDEESGVDDTEFGIAVDDESSASTDAADTGAEEVDSLGPASDDAATATESTVDETSAAESTVDEDWTPEPTTMDEDGIDYGVDDDGPEFVYCQSCGEEMAAEVEVCPNCGDPQSADATATESGEIPAANVEGKSGSDGEKSPVVAAALSFFIPGVGQIYNDEAKKGLVVLAVWFACLWGFVLAFPLLISFVAWVYATIDAYSQAKKINRGEVVVD